jgi:hypothetical protein
MVVRNGRLHSPLRSMPGTLPSGLLNTRGFGEHLGRGWHAYQHDSWSAMVYRLHVDAHRRSRRPASPPGGASRGGASSACAWAH